MLTAWKDSRIEPVRIASKSLLQTNTFWPRNNSRASFDVLDQTSQPLGSDRAGDVAELYLNSIAKGKETGISGHKCVILPKIGSYWKGTVELDLAPVLQTSCTYAAKSS